MRASVAFIALGNLVSKALGLVREVAFASLFGTGTTAAAYRIAQTGFLMPVHSLVGDSLGAGLLPLYRKLEVEGHGEQRLLVLVATTYGLLFSAITTTVLFIFSERVARLIAPGAEFAALQLASQLLSVMAVATPFYVLSGMFSFVEAAHGSFSAIGWRPALLNLGAIAGVLLAFGLRDDLWLAITLVGSHGVFLGWTLVQVSRLGSVWPSCLPKASEAVRMMWRFGQHMLPLLAVPLVGQANVLVERVTASRIGTEVIPGAEYARFVSDTMVQLVALPLSVLTMASHGGERGDGVNSHVLKLTRAILVLSVPVGIFVAGNARALTEVLFGRGAFDAHSVDVTAPILTWMGAAVGPAVTGFYLVRALNAQLRNKEALVFTALAALSNITVNLSLWRWLGTETIGVSFAGHSVVLFVLSAHALELGRPVAFLVVRLVPVLALQLVIGRFATGGLGGAAGLAVCGALTALLWAAAVTVDPTIRSSASPILERIPGLRRYVR